MNKSLRTISSNTASGEAAASSPSVAEDLLGCKSDSCTCSVPARKGSTSEGSFTRKPPSSRVSLDSLRAYSSDQRGHHHCTQDGVKSADGERTLAGLDGFESDERTQRRTLLEELSKQRYYHPLANLHPVNGKLPFVEMSDSPQGNRYAIRDFYRIDKNGNERRVSGVIEVPLQDSPGQVGPHVSIDKGRVRACVHSCTHSPSDIGNSERQRPPTQKMGFSLRKAISQASRGEDLSIHVRLARPNGMTITVQLEGEIARGRIQTRADYEIIREQRLLSHQLLISRLQAPVIAEIEGLGGVIQFRGKTLAVLTATLPSERVSQLAKDPAVCRLDLATTRLRLEADPFDNYAIEVGAQFDQFLEPENLKKTLLTPNDGILLTFAMVDGGVLRTHQGFKYSGKQTIKDRFTETYVCDMGGCKIEYNICTLDSGSCSHGTAVAGIIFGDFTRGQILVPPQNIDRREVSGYARRATGVLYQGNRQSAFDQLALQFPKPVALNMSAGDYDLVVDDVDFCNGLDTASQDANDLYESGILLIKSAGNLSLPEGEFVPNATYNPQRCLVTPPGSAIGVFTVGNYNVGVPVKVKNVRTSPIRDRSSRGGQPNDFARGRGRSIVDIAAHGAGSQYFSTSSNNNVNYKIGDTSFAAPVVTAAAIVLTDYFRNRLKSDLLDDPGFLYSNLLLMGDRSAGESGPPVKISSGFDRNYGSGRLKMRRFDVDPSVKPNVGHGGMGPPFIRENTSACIGAGESLQFFLNDQVEMPEGADILKFVIWWYDRRHEILTSQGRIVNLDIYLWECDKSWKATKKVANSISPFDNKERIFYAPMGGLSGKRLMLQVFGAGGFKPGFDYKVGCSPGKIRFHFSYFCESNARPGPGLSFIPNGIGVEPENLP